VFADNAHDRMRGDPDGNGRVTIRDGNLMARAV
jgi:hypothetical protein